MTKRKIFNEKVALCTAGLLLMSAGCLNTDQREDIRDAAHSAILEYIENQGTVKLEEFIDQLVADGKLGTANAEKIKEAIPMGIEKLREVMGELEQEEANNE